MNTLLSDHPWIAAIAVLVFFAILIGWSFLNGKKGEIPMDLDNPDMDRRRPDVGTTDSRILPRN